jgi:hypothetical protein
MTDGKRTVRWKLVTIGMAFAIGSALETGFVGAHWTTKDSDRKVVEVCQGWAAGPQTVPATCSAQPFILPWPSRAARSAMLERSSGAPSD